jgi:hypothetical protein
MIEDENHKCYYSTMYVRGSACWKSEWATWVGLFEMFYWKYASSHVPYSGAQNTRRKKKITQEQKIRSCKKRKIRRLCGNVNSVTLHKVLSETRSHKEWRLTDHTSRITESLEMHGRTRFRLAYIEDTLSQSTSSIWFPARGSMTLIQNAPNVARLTLLKITHSIILTN